jgi:hypothetical protein
MQITFKLWALLIVYTSSVGSIRGVCTGLIRGLEISAASSRHAPSPSCLLTVDTWHGRPIVLLFLPKTLSPKVQAYATSCEVVMHFIKWSACMHSASRMTITKI